MRSHRLNKVLTCINTVLPDHLTQELIEKILSLPSNPKTDYLKEVFLDKFVSSDTAPAIVRRQRAINKWLATEMNNAATYDRLQNTDPEFNILPGVGFNRFVEKVQSIIREILTVRQKFQLEGEKSVDIVTEVPTWEDLLKSSFSGGASTSRPRLTSFPAGKYVGQADVTQDCHSFFLDLIEDSPLWKSFFDEMSINVVKGNILFTVPKNADIDRVACKEPDLNMYLQKGIGSLIRSRLRNHGVDLNDQSVNKSLARKGSIDGTLATLDLSSASDSVSYGLVELLLPVEWFSLLVQVRSPFTMIDGDAHRNEMFSSMGNGYTFELESLIFYSIARAVSYFEGVPGVVSVYGDDIIVPVETAQLLTFCLEWFGFSVNTEKSFYDGPFRESCGGHFVNGLDITPFYLRKPIEKLTDLIKILNRIRFWSISSIGINDPEVYDLWWSFAQYVPKCFWGGREYSSIGQLVSPHKGYLCLTPIKRKPVSTGHGGYIYWHNLAYYRLTAWDTPLETSTYVQETQVYQKRKAKGYWTELRDVFLEEILVTPTQFSPFFKR